MTRAVADSEFRYAGSELELFEKARNWKAYWRAQIRGFIRGDVLEVGAGIGANTLTLAGLKYERWTCLEPDAALAARIALPPGGRHEPAVGTIDTLPAEAQFDAVLYIDVLEHIEDDRAELARAAARLKPGGALIVLAPAHPFLFTPFDAAIGHFRRYTHASLFTKPRPLPSGWKSWSTWTRRGCWLPPPIGCCCEAPCRQSGKS